MGILLLYKGADTNNLFSCHFDGSQWIGNDKIRTSSGAAGFVPAFLESTCTPAAAWSPNEDVTSGQVLMVYKAADSTELRMASLNGSSWDQDVEIKGFHGSIRPPISDQMPAVALFNDSPVPTYNNTMFLVFKYANSNDLFVAYLDTMGYWHWSISISILTNGVISPKSNVGPNVAAFNNKLYIIYKGESSNNLYLTTFDGTEFTGDVKISSQPGGIVPESTGAPGLAVFNNRLYMVYRSPNNYDLNYAFFDGTAWHGNSEIWKQPGGIRPESSCNPGLGVFQDRLFVFYKSPSEQRPEHRHLRRNHLVREHPDFQRTRPYPPRIRWRPGRNVQLTHVAGTAGCLIRGWPRLKQPGSRSDERSRGGPGKGHS